MITANVRPGTYVVAVSGGIDSMVLLDMLQKLPDVQLVVAHFDHGIRNDSGQDRNLVENTAAKAGLPFYFAEGNLGAGTSEAMAREARYKFLKSIQNETSAQAIITAHHQDDLIETAILNLLRGTNRRGLSALSSSNELLRPLLAYSKQQLLDYAKEHDIEWREDSTNTDESYLRNYVRLNIVPALSVSQRNQLTELLSSVAQTNTELDTALAVELTRISVEKGISRPEFVTMPHSLAREVLALWLRTEGVREYDKAMLERLVVAAKTAQPGKEFDVIKGARLAVHKDYLALAHV